MSVEDQVAADEPIVMVRMSKQQGCLNPGDIAGFPASRAARIVADKSGIEMVEGVDVDKDGNPLRSFGESPLAGDVDSEARGEGDGGNGDGNETWVFDPKTDPFVTDGISHQASKSLHARGLYTVESVRLFISATPEDEAAIDRIIAIEGVTEAQAEKIVKLYGIVSEHSEE